MNARRPVPQEVREHAVKAVRELHQFTTSLTAAVGVVARNLGVHPNTVRNWMTAAEPVRMRPAGATEQQRALAVAEQVRVLAELNAGLTRALREERSGR